GLGGRGIGEESGRLDDDVGTDRLPVELGRVALLERHDLLVADVDGALVVRHVRVETTQDRVVLEQRGQRGVVGQIVDGDDLDIGAGGTHGAEEVAADPAESVDTYAN